MLNISDLNAAYGEQHVLWDLSLRIAPGEIAVLAGANGAGKSTALRVISGLLRAQSGRIIFAGEEITRQPAHRIVESGLIHVPEARRLFPMLTVEENLFMGSYTPAARRRRSAGLEKVYVLFPHLKGRRRQLAGTLSGGEQQMVAIARGLMGWPRLLMLDEPSLGLAPMLVKELFTTIRRINQDGVTILLVEQNLRQALQIAHHGYVLESGRIRLQGTGAELLNHEHIKQAYLGL